MSLHSMVPIDRKIWIVLGHLIMSLHYGFHYFSLLDMSLECQESVVKNLLKVILWSLSTKYNVNFLISCLYSVGERPWTGREMTWVSQEKFNWCRVTYWPSEYALWFLNSLMGKKSNWNVTLLIFIQGILANACQSHFYRYKMQENNLLHWWENSGKLMQYIYIHILFLTF